MDQFANLYQLGQSLWYDNIQRKLLKNGELQEMVARGEIYGVTSNPTIFNNAISKSADYDDAIQPMAWAGWSAEGIFFQLAVEDIRAAADIFKPVYEKTAKKDGYVSLEVSPFLAKDTEGTLKQALELWKMVDRPNLMIKIPATIEGLPAIRQAIAAGLNINVTLIFSLERYQQVIDAYLSGLEDRLQAGQAIDSIHSVASFFISRADSKVDPLLQALAQGENDQKAIRLLGKTAIANARLAYEIFDKVFKSERFQVLKSKGANLQRPLWASTSTKNPSYPDLLYVDTLIVPYTVNTVPPQTLEAFRAQGQARIGFNLDEDIEEARRVIAELESLGISMHRVTEELEEEGVKSFADSFGALLKTIQLRSQEARAQLGPLAGEVPGWVEELTRKRAISRMFAADASLWTEDAAGQDEIHKRLGWLDAPARMGETLEEATAFAHECQRKGITHALVLGMGGSSMGPEVLALTKEKLFGKNASGIKVRVLDSTNPMEVKAAARWSKPENTLYIVSSKSGTTSEVNAFLAYFWENARRRLGEKAGDHFVAITDPGTLLEKTALSLGFRKVFPGVPEIGGRFSVISPFGLVPGALLGLDLGKFLRQAESMAHFCQPETPEGRNPGLVLGAILGGAEWQGRDKLTLIADPEVQSFGAWLEQLVAESSGKQGKGIVPVDLEPFQPMRVYGRDRLFVYLRFSGAHAEHARKLAKAGHPVLIYPIQDIFDLGQEFYRWEIAVAVACSMLGVNVFDQPDVQDNKTRTAKKIEQFKRNGSLGEDQPWLTLGEWEVHGQQLEFREPPKSIKEVVREFLHQAKPGEYVAINAYLERSGRTLAALQRLRKQVMKTTAMATTLGFGPRFLHSTGQLHKGGADNGLFLQITCEPQQDLDIPESGMTFGVLQRAQALGDLEALLARNRRALRIHLKGWQLSRLAELLD